MAGYCLACQLHQLKASTAIGPGITIFLTSAILMCGLEKLLGLLIKN